MTGEAAVNDRDNPGQLREDLMRLGGLSPFECLRRIVAPEGSMRECLEPRNAVLTKLLRYFFLNPSEEQDGTIKQILWDARAATLVATDLPAQERERRLEALDEIGRATLSRPTA